MKTLNSSRTAAVAATVLSALLPLSWNASAAEARWLPDPKPRLFVLTDISNEPDDEESMVRLLVCANEFDLEGMSS